MALQFPTTQGELIRRARGVKSQTAFAKELGVGRTSLCRYESELSGAPTKVINFCLSAVAAQAGQSGTGSRPVEQALDHVRQAVGYLERVTKP
jgi:DNA-binding XRE family transcriptional regulator